MIYLENENGFEMLANAIVKQAADDYRSASKTLVKKPDSFSAKERIKEVEKFLRSGWYMQLTTVEGEYILQRLKEEVVEYRKKSVKENRGRKKRKTA